MSVVKDAQSVLDVLYQTFAIFPHSAMTIARQRELPSPEERVKDGNDGKDGKDGKDKVAVVQQRDISERLHQLCNSTESVSFLLARTPEMSPGDAWKKLYGHGASEKSDRPSSKEADTPARTGVDRVAECGKWGPTKPSELFLTMFRDALSPVENDLSQALVSPSLMGSCGVLPLTIISVIPDIARHMSNLIVRAEKEVILATNYWQNSVASKFLTNAMKELSRRAGERGSRVVIKVIYDRGAIKQLIEPHYIVSEKEYTGSQVGLPSPAEIPNIDMQVMNYHHPLLGTFHSKFMVVDRKIAILQSNNIQDNDNLEMMVHLEGPIVDSIYDMALVSWHKELEPKLPSHNSPAVEGGLDGSFVKNHDSVLVQPGKIVAPPPAQSSDPDRADIVTGKTTTRSTTHPVNPNHAHMNGDAVPEGHVPGQGKPEGEDIRQFIRRGSQDIPETQIQQPSSKDHPLPEHMTTDPHYDVDIAGEVARVQTGVSPRPGETRMQAVTRHLNHTTNKKVEGTAPECAPHEEMTPYIPHAAHEPFPIAFVCRPPYGTPNHKSVSTPQNEAWLSALRNATKSVFIQSPTLNAEPLVPAIIEACERGVDVYCYICIGYNDSGELLPMQGGHNEMVAYQLYAALSPAGKERLHYSWYVGKDQTRPILQERKQRSCHIKLMIVDEHIGIVGSGNQDTQSWFHSQETNIMIDSADVCRAWMDGLRRNQNTHLYGALGKDGVWRDEEGKEVEGSIGPDPGKFSWAKGLMGALKRVQGKGGFG